MIVIISKNGKVIYLLSLMLLSKLAVFAADTLPANKSDKIEWVLRKCGPMPSGMVTSLILLAIAAGISVLYYKSTIKNDLQNKGEKYGRHKTKKKR